MTERINRVLNLFDGSRPIQLLPGIFGYPGVQGIPSGFESEMGIDLIEMHPNTRFPTHTHPGAHILFVLFGEGFIKIGDDTYETRPGDAYFVPADVPHSVGAGKTSHRLLAIGFPHKELTADDRMEVIYDHAPPPPQTI